MSLRGQVLLELIHCRMRASGFSPFQAIPNELKITFLIEYSKLEAKSNLARLLFDLS